MDRLVYLCNLFYKLASDLIPPDNLGSFDWNTFTSKKDPKEMFEYAEANLTKTDDYGSARGVFILDSAKGYALKIALPDNLSGGIHQNRQEALVSAVLPEITANVIYHHPQYYWMIVELAKPLSSLDELIQELNLSSPLDIGFLFGKFPPRNHKLLKQPNPIALTVSKLVNEGILPRDVVKSDSWGHTIGANSRLVLLDYGRLK